MSTSKLVKLGPKARKRLRARRLAAEKAPRPTTKPATARAGVSADKAGPAATEGGGKRGALPSKASFIMSFGADVPTRTIVEAGAKRGLKFTQNYVSRIRSLDKARRKRGHGDDVGLRRSSALRATDLDARERTFARLAIDLGLANAERILASVKQQLGALRL